jgi:hypothetical protein
MIRDAPTASAVLAQRSTGGVEVTLTWIRRGDRDETVVCVRDEPQRTYFEIPAEPYLALDVYYHPYFYRDFSTVDHQVRWLAA